MNWLTLHTVLFVGLPLLFAGLTAWLHNRLATRKPWLKVGGYMLVGYALLGTYRMLSDGLTAWEKAGVINEETVKVLTEPATLTRGKVIFESRCVTCHGPNGEGAIGPNLTDEYWLYGGSIKDIFRTIRHGISDTPMVAWKYSLSDEEQQAVANYVYNSLYRTNPPNSKPPQGFIYIRSASPTPIRSAGH